MASLEEKQKYYEYGRSGWTFKQPPIIDPVLQKELTRIGGTDRFGDPRWRFNWGGACIVQRFIGDRHPHIIGPLSALKLDGGKFSPDRPVIPTLRSHAIHGKQMEPAYMCFIADDGKITKVGDQRYVPKGKISWWEFNHVWYGKLRWFIEVKLEPEELVQAGIYRADDPNVPSRGDYLWKLTIQTPSGHYFEPDEKYLEMVVKHTLENETESLSDLYRKDKEKRDADEAASEEAEHAGKVRLVEAIMANAAGQSVEEFFQR
ncbi:MAG TPA: hypothetical protein VJS44_08385 [Pyrinomonadaceae bacterium]|nr:hypothetical protein [Pyrinomonadaceae bacterium]